MKKIRATVCLFLLCSTFLFAAPVSLSGTVKSSTGNAIASAKLTVAGQTTLTATTDTQGAFTISGDIPVSVFKSSALAKSPCQISLSGNALVITSIFENIKGKVDIFSSNGRKTVSILFKGTSAGKQSVMLPEFTSGLNLLQITIGEETFTQTLVCLGKSTRYLKSGIPNAAAAGSFTLGKRASAPAVDTLITTMTGYKEKKEPIDSYEKTGIEIVLEEDGGTTGPMPLVYEKEHTGANCPKPPLPAVAGLTSCKYLPDPFEWSDASRGRIKTRADWRCRRAEILEEILKYEGGQKPPKPEKFEATLSGSTIKITMGVGSNSFSMNVTIKRPGNAPKDTPIPAIINKGSLNYDFAGKGIAEISYSQGDVTGSNMFGDYKTGNFYKLYPSTDAGYMVRWAWQVSRIIDALELLPEAYIDTKHLAVSGCSYQGKIALYAGAMDERIALTIPHESGGGGTISWRYSDMLETRDKTEVENLKVAQGASWYSNALREFTKIPDKLPFDQHEFIALCLPRAILCIESSKIARMGAEAARVDAVAARKVYSAFGIEDRIGVTEANVDHCTWSSSYTPDLDAYVSKFLLGKEVNTKILRSKFTSVDTTTWIPWSAPKLL